MNSTEAESIWSRLPVPDMIYTSLGIAMSLGNGLITTAIASNKHLRQQKEMLLMAGLAVADFIYGFVTILAGVLRMDMRLRGVITQLVTPWDCMKWPPTFLFTLSQQTVGLMMVIISVDRYIAVTRFSTYRSMGRDYAYKVLSLVIVYGAMFVVALFIVSYFLTERIANKTRQCSGPYSAPPVWFGTIDSGLSSFYGYLSVVIYGVVYYKYRKHYQKSTVIQSDTVRALQLANQRRLTVTLGIVTFFTFVFFCTPYSFSLVANYFGTALIMTPNFKCEAATGIFNLQKLHLTLAQTWTRFDGWGGYGRKPPQIPKLFSASRRKFFTTSGTRFHFFHPPNHFFILGLRPLGGYPPIPRVHVCSNCGI